MYKVFTNQYWLRILSVLLFLATASTVHVATAETATDTPTFIEGKHYTLITPRREIPNAPADKIIVQEFFWYGCPHCFHLEPYLSQWKIPDDVDLSLIHISEPTRPY